MVVPDDIRKCVAFIGLRMADGSFRFAGSLFFLGKTTEGGVLAGSMYAVTARHVIDNIRKTGVTESYLRVNLKDGQAQWFKAPLSTWFVHPTDLSIDVAILPMGLPEPLDHLYLPYSLCATEQQMKDNEVGVGEEVFVTGLFKHHHGSRRNIPIVRVGNLACMTEEKVATNHFGEMDAFLIEARSIGGLSGSPVFLSLGSSRVIKGTVRLGPNDPPFLLLGLVHGHYDVGTTEIDRLSDDGTDAAQNDYVNTGIAIVVPFNKIDAVVSAFEASRAEGGRSDLGASQ